MGALFASVLIAIAIPITHSQATGTARPLAVLNVGVAMDSEAPAAPEQLPPAPTRSEPVTFTLHENGLQSERSTRQMTVAAALGELGLDINGADVVSPARDANLTPGMHVYVTYALRLILMMGTTETPLYTQARTVGDALAGAGYELEPRDWVFPSKATPLYNGMTIALTTIRDVQQDDSQTIPFQAVYRNDSTLAKGKQVIVQAGVDGSVNRSWEVRQVNGAETSRRLISETKVPATTQIVSVGTYVAPAPEPAAAPDGSHCVTTMTVWSTFYTAASAGGSTTRTGTGVYKGIVAVDPRVIPLGTRMYIPGYGYGLAADTGGGVKGAWIDVAYGPDDVYDWYSHYVDICILG